MHDWHNHIVQVQPEVSFKSGFKTRKAAVTGS